MRKRTSRSRHLIQPVAMEKPVEATCTMPSWAPLACRYDGSFPTNRLDWALWWSQRGMAVFPAEEFLGTPLEPKWYANASSERGHITAWWAQTPDADIAALPERSGHFVIIARGRQGRLSYFELSDHEDFPTPDFFYQTRWGDLHAWLKGSMFSSHDRLGPGIDVVGPGRFVYLPPSAAPDCVY